MWDCRSNLFQNHGQSVQGPYRSSSYSWVGGSWARVLPSITFSNPLATQGRSLAVELVGRRILSAARGARLRRRLAAEEEIAEDPHRIAQVEPARVVGVRRV